MAICNANAVCQNPLGACAKKCALRKTPRTHIRAIPMHDVDGLSLLARMVWLNLRDEGGWWSAKELARALLPSDVNDTSAIGQCLRALLERKLVVQRSGSRMHPATYGVTAKCCAPAGMTLEPSQ